MADASSIPVPYVETFEPLAELPGLVHGFVLRHPDIPVGVDRAEVLSRLASHFRESLQKVGVFYDDLIRAEQVHGGDVVAADALSPGTVVSSVDGLITQLPGQTLGIYVADCCAVFLADPENRACGLVHSGKKGSEAKIAARAVAEMKERYGTNPAKLVTVLSPCIRPPAYEVDFAAQIREQLAESGVPMDQIRDSGACTSSDLERYYSYRMEKGSTGRMLAVLGWRREA